MTTSRKKLHNSWERDLAKLWRSNPITFCEVRFEGCYGTYGLAPAHSMRRGRIDTKEKFFEVVAACKFCHDTLDQKMTPDECLEKVREIIAARDY